MRTRPASGFPWRRGRGTREDRFALSIPDAQNLECKRGSIETVRDVSELPLQWTTGWESCAIGQGCQETVILLVNGKGPRRRHAPPAQLRPQSPGRKAPPTVPGVQSAPQRGNICSAMSHALPSSMSSLQDAAALIPTRLSPSRAPSEGGALKGLYWGEGSRRPRH